MDTDRNGTFSVRSRGNKMRQDVAAALEIHNMVTRRRVKKWKHGLRDLEDTLLDEETCLSIVDGGADEHGIGLVMVTDIRLILWSPRLGLTDLLAYEIGALSAENIYGRDAVVVMHQVGQIVIRYGEVSMSGMGSISSAYGHFTQVLNEVVRSAVPPPSTEPSPATGSVADELTKLADLLDRGLLTPEEFNEQKRRLMS